MRLALALASLLAPVPALAQMVHQFTGQPSLDAAVIACDAHLAMPPPGPAGQGVTPPSVLTWQVGYESCPGTMAQWSAAVAAIAAAPRPVAIPPPVPQPRLRPAQ